MSMNQTNVPVRPLPDTAYYTEQPVSTGEWFWTMLLMAIPVVNIVLMFVWAFGGSAKVSKRNYFRASLLWAAIIIGIYVLIFVLIAAIGGGTAFMSGIMDSVRGLR